MRVKKEKGIVFNYVFSPACTLLLIWQQIMKRLIKRYVLKAQVDKENDEVNEGKNEAAFAVFRDNFCHVVLGIGVYSGAWRFRVRGGFVSTSSCSCSAVGENHLPSLGIPSSSSVS